MKKSDLVVLNIGPRSEFKNPIKVGEVLTDRQYDLLDDDDKKKYIHPLKPREAYYLFAKYIYPKIVRNPLLLVKLMYADKYRCPCTYGKWCIANIYRQKFYKPHEVSRKQVSHKVS